MKRSGLIHPELAAVVAGLGHGDLLCISDAGLPVPRGVRRIDLAYRLGQPPFLDVVRCLVAELVVEEWIVAEETHEVSPAIFGELGAVMGDVDRSELTHDEFKDATTRATVIIRTGEGTPYANVLLRSGVSFA